jgi:subtilase family serine protease
MVSISVKTETGKTRIFYNLSIEQCICLLITLVLVMLSFTFPPASADYNFDGVPETDELEEVEEGTVYGSVYVDGGHGVGPSPYTQSFNVPEGEVKWAQLYVGVWGGSETKKGYIDVTFNGEELGKTLELKGEDDTNSNVYCSGHGVYWIVYDVKESQATGSVDAVVTTSGTIDGRVYGVVLVAVIKEEDGRGAPEVQYWINEGNVNLHGPGWSGIYGTNDEAVAEFAGTIDVDKFVAARLSVVYLTGTPSLNDYLYFNDEKLCNGDNCNDIANSKQNFDFKTFDVIEYIEKEANKATFELGDEDYVHPVLAVLTVHGVEPDEETSCVSLSANIIPAVSIEVTPDMLNFGTLASGQTSSEHTISISNTGAYTVAVTADVTDTADNLYVSGLQLDSSIWNAYTTEITVGAAVDSVAVLDVPDSYTGVGAKEGTLVFWAQKV